MTTSHSRAIAASRTKRDSAAPVSPGVLSRLKRVDTGIPPRTVRWWRMGAAVIGLSILLALTPGRASIPPLVQSDYCYLLIAADRMFDGFGPTTPPPVAPFQPWSWQADYSFLTRWPIGYPAMVCAVRRATGISTLEACGLISVVACAAALVGWFEWVRRSVPRGVTGILLAGVAAGCSVSAAALINPSTDAVLVGVLPFILLLVAAAIRRVPNPAARSGETATAHELAPAANSPDRLEAPKSVPKKPFFRDAPVRKRAGTCEKPLPDGRGSLRGYALQTPSKNAGCGMAPLVLAGLLSGALVWIRYAALFVPLAIGLFLILSRLRQKTPSWPRISLFGACAALPILALIAVNQTFGMAESVQEQLNLGQTARWDLSPSLITRAWWQWTDFGFYDYHWFTHWAYALWPLVLIAAVLCVPRARRAATSLLATPATSLSASLVLVLFAVLIGATTLFGDKYDYAGLARYYTPIRPLYFALFAAPILLVPWRSVRVIACVGLLVAGSWLLRQEWPRPLQKWSADTREVTPYGQWARAFSPHAGDLHRWIMQQSSRDLVLVSNFHEYVALETGIPALPIPPDRATLDEWLARIRESRGIDEVRVLFVLDPDNRWRDYWLPPPAQLIQTFGLTRRLDTATAASVNVFEYPTATDQSPQVAAGLAVE